MPQSIQQKRLKLLISDVFNEPDGEDLYEMDEDEYVTEISGPRRDLERRMAKTIRRSNIYAELPADSRREKKRDAYKNGLQASMSNEIDPIFDKLEP